MTCSFVFELCLQTVGWRLGVELERDVWHYGQTFFIIFYLKHRTFAPLGFSEHIAYNSSLAVEMNIPLLLYIALSSCHVV